MNMNAEIPQHVLDAADVSAVTQVILRERESRDEDDGADARVLPATMR